MEILLKSFNKHFNKKVLVTLFFLVAMLMVSGCVTKSKEKVTIFAASSLTNAVTDIANDYQKINKDQEVFVNFAGSKTLRAQLENGAEGHIFISANEQHYKALLDQGLVLEGKKLLTNQMVLVLAKTSEVDIESLEDLRTDHQLILAQEGVPAGDYARKVLGQLNELYGEDYDKTVLGNLVSSESNVRQVLTKVVLGEGDAALVYKTDVTEDIRDRVRLLEIPEGYNVSASYWIALVNNDNIEGNVRECYEALFNETSDSIFEQYGFMVVE